MLQIPDHAQSKEAAMRISGARVLTSDKCAAIVKRSKGTTARERDEEIRMEQKKREKEEEQKKKKALAAEKKALVEHKKALMAAKKAEKEA